MTAERKDFAALFKRYRLKSEFETLSEFGSALTEKGFLYEDSIFSHWQKGTRVPQQRVILLKLLEIFIDHKAITTIDQANSFLAAANQGYLSEKELSQFDVSLREPIFQVPNENDHFSNRDELIRKIIHQKISGQIICIHGTGGVGKTSLAIRLGHILKEKYTDGVLWYKVEKDNTADILLSIARTFGEDISNIRDLNVRSTIVRSLLSSRSVLLILDSAELSPTIQLLIPNSRFCTTIITSQDENLKIKEKYIDIPINAFNDREALNLFKEVLKGKYPTKQKKTLLRIARRVGNLPLALDLIAKQLEHSDNYLNQLSDLLSEENIFFKQLYKEDKNLYLAINLSYSNLDTNYKTILKSVAIFKGKDFAVNSIAYINGLSLQETKSILEKLKDLSLLETSTRSRYRIHPMIQNYVQERINYPRSIDLIFIASGIFTFFTLWWIYREFFEAHRDSYRIWEFYNLYFIIALYGGLLGVHTSLRWGGIKSLLGRSILAFSLGLFTQCFGQIAYSYYGIALHNPNVYPSIGDFGFFATIPFYIYGILLLAKASGINLSFRLFRERPMALLVPITILVSGYFMFLRNYIFDWANPIKIFLDFGYPLGDAIYVSIAILVFIFSRSILDGIMRTKASLILVALIVQFIADYIFAETSSTYYAGNYIDFLELLSYYLMTVALLSLKSIRVKTSS